jgi:cyclomaltodextrinase
MNQKAVFHTPDSKYCFAYSNRELIIRLRTSNEDNLKVSIVYGHKYDFQNYRRISEMKKCYSDRDFDYYEIRFVLSDVRFAYIFQIDEEGKVYFYSEDGITETYNYQESFYNFFQMPYINSNDVMPEVSWMKNAVFYQIFVDRFNIGNKKKDMSYVNMEWGDIPTPKSFAGGDIRGITEKLDYIKDLGITAVYLTPIFKSVSNHKYDISDYYLIDPQFGTDEDLHDLVEKAHRKGIRVILDAVFNHCSSLLPQFQDVVRKGKESDYYNWFLIDGDFPDESMGNYECFASCTYMPKLNTSDRGVQEFLLDVARYWIRKFNIDGWRLDVSDEVSHDFWRMFRKAVKAEKSDAVIIGENWHDARTYLMGDQYDSIMNYSFTKACLDYFAFNRLDARGMAERLNSLLMRNSWQVNDMMLNLLDSHDTHRFFSEVGENKDRLLAGLALEMIFPGASCIYYGTEICIPGGYDPDSRRCFNWDEKYWDNNFIKKVKGLIHLKKNGVISDGSIRILSEKNLMIVKRTEREKCSALYINLTDKTSETSVQLLEVLSSNRAEGSCDRLVINPDGYVLINEKADEGNSDTIIRY